MSNRWPPIGPGPCSVPPPAISSWMALAGGAGVTLTRPQSQRNWSVASSGLLVAFLDSRAACGCAGEVACRSAALGPLVASPLPRRAAPAALPADGLAACRKPEAMALIGAGMAGLIGQRCRQRWRWWWHRRRITQLQQHAASLQAGALRRRWACSSRSRGFDCLPVEALLFGVVSPRFAAYLGVAGAFAALRPRPHQRFYAGIARLCGASGR